MRTRALRHSLALIALSALVPAALLLPGAGGATAPGSVSGAASAGAVAASQPSTITAYASPITWRPSRALGEPFDGRLVNGVQLPARGADYLTWDPILERRPNRSWRRWGTDRLIRLLLRIGRRFRAAHPGAGRLLVGDLSRPRGGDFGPRFGAPGHASHQNGLDVDLYYPRRDRRPLAPTRVSQVDLRLAQDLVDRFTRAGAEYVFVGPRTQLSGPGRVVQPLELHDDHMHVRIHNPLR